MDKIKNPFSPGAGTPPPELVGRDELLEDASVLFARTKLKRPEKGILLTGLRGVGKTVLLNEMERVAKEKYAYETMFLELREESSISLQLIPKLKNLLYKLSLSHNISDKARRAIAVLKSFISGIRVKTDSGVEYGIDIDPESGSADSGDISIDMPNLLVAVAEAALEHNTCIAIFIDEIQFMNTREFEAIILAMHRMQQLQLPMVLVGGGLPILFSLAGESKSYAERLFNFPYIGKLSKEDSIKAVQDPIIREKECIDEDALEEIYRITEGYPYFIQEWGYQVWNKTKCSPITLQDVQEASQTALKRLDENFFKVRFARLTPKEKTFLRFMAEIGDADCKTSSVADLMHKKMSDITAIRSSLLKKGMIFSPAHGYVAYTVPLFGEFLKRIIPQCA